MNTQDKLFLQIADKTCRNTLFSQDNILNLLHTESLDIPAGIDLGLRTITCAFQTPLETIHPRLNGFHLDMLWTGELVLQHAETKTEQVIPMKCAFVLTEGKQLTEWVRHGTTARRMLDQQDEMDTFVVVLMPAHVLDDQDWPADITPGSNSATKRQARIDRIRQWLHPERITLWVVDL